MAAPDGSRTQPRTVPEVPLLDWAWIKPAKASDRRGRASLEGNERESFIIWSIESRAGSGLFHSNRRARSSCERHEFSHERTEGEGLSKPVSGRSSSMSGLRVLIRQSPRPPRVL